MTILGSFAAALLLGGVGTAPVVAQPDEKPETTRVDAPKPEVVKQEGPKSQPPVPSAKPSALPKPTAVSPPPPRTIAPLAVAKTDPFQVTLSLDGRSIHLSGDIREGLTTSLKSLIEKNPGVKIVVLSSFGGSIVEGRAIEKTIRAKGLDTHVEMVCASACTLAFMGGKNRTIGKHARLGYHQAKRSVFSFAVPEPNPKESAGNRALRIFSKKHGLSAEFVDRMLDVDPKDMWFPDPDELLKEKIVNSKIPPTFGQIGADAKWPNADSMISEVMTEPFWKKVLAKNHTAYMRAAGTVWLDQKNKKTKLAPPQAARYGLMATLMKDVDQFPDDLVLRIIANQAAIWGQSESAFNEACKYSYERCAPIAVAVKGDLAKAQEQLISELLDLQLAKVNVEVDRLVDAEARLLDFWADLIASGSFTSSNVARKFGQEPLDYYERLMEIPAAERIVIYRDLMVMTLTPQLLRFDN